MQKGSRHQNTNPVVLNLHPADSILSDKSALQLLQKYCTKNALFSRSKPDDNLSVYYDKTLQMLQKELGNTVINPENVCTIISNLALIAANVDFQLSQNSKSPVSFTNNTPDFDALTAILAQYWKMSRNSSETASPRKSPLGIVFGILSIISGALFLSAKALIFSAPPLPQPETTGFLWFKKTVEPITIPFWQNPIILQKIAITSLIITIIALSIALLNKKYYQSSLKKSKMASDYKTLCRLIYSAKDHLEKEASQW